METKKTFQALQTQPDLSIKLVEQEISPITDDQVLIKVEAAPLNPSDILNARGFYQLVPPPYRLGHEGSGTVAEVGKNFASKFKIGDKVSFKCDFGALGSWAQYFTVNGDSAFHMHPENTFEEAASHFCNPTTLMLMLREVQNEGHKAVIHSAGASALGKMMIRLFKENGIKTINLVRRDDVKDELMKIGADYVLNMTDADFEKQLAEIVNKENATKFYDAVAGDLTVPVLKLMPRGSVVTLYGVLSGKADATVSIADIFAGRTLNSFEVWSPYFRLSSQEKVKLADDIQKMLKTTLKSEVIKTFPLDKFQEAIEYAQANASKGKVLWKPWEK